MLQQDKPDGHVLATGEMTNVRQFLERAFAEVDIALEWRPASTKWLRLRVRCLPCGSRSSIPPPDGSRSSAGDPTKARQKLSWQHKNPVRELVAEKVREVSSTGRP